MCLPTLTLPVNVTMSACGSVIIASPMPRGLPVTIDSISGGNISAQWYHFDCLNNAPFTNGSKGEAPISNACPGGNGSGVVNCANCGGFGDWHFVIDAPLDGTFDMAQGQNPGGVCWIDELAYALQMGPCTGVQGRGERQQARNRSTVQ